MSRDEKQDWVIPAIYRMYRTRRVKAGDLFGLLQTRAKMPERKAEQLSSIWKRFTP